MLFSNVIGFSLNDPRRQHLVILCLLTWVWSGCATIFSHHSQVTPISLPQNAAIYDTTGTQIPTFRTQYGGYFMNRAGDLFICNVDLELPEQPSQVTIARALLGTMNPEATAR